jgi:formylglycine-generating enzyme required for sulfatase activity
MKFTALLVVALSAVAFSPSAPALKLPKLFKKTFAEVPLNAPAAETLFFASLTEVSNLQYREFLHAVRLKHPEWVELAQPDTAQWVAAGAEPLSAVYHHHPAYNDYPVVNISQEAARTYCEWLTRFNRDEGLFSEAKTYRVTYRLPTQKEWQVIAEGKRAGSKYAWGGPEAQNAKGCALGNFADLSADVQETLTAPVMSYNPNAYGVYNMNGNVAEWLDEPEFAAGGSWMTPAENATNAAAQRIQGASPGVGFRVVAIVERVIDQR